MFEIGEVVWIEYDGSEAFVGQIIGLDEEEVMLNQVVEFKLYTSMTPRLIASATEAVNGLAWKSVKAQFLSYMGLAGLPWLVMGERAVRTKLLWLVAEEGIRNGQGYLRTLDTPMRVVLPRGGAVFKDAEVAIDAMIGKTSEGDGEEVETTADVDAEVSAFRDSLDEFGGFDVEVEGEAPTDTEPNNKPDF